MQSFSKIVIFATIECWVTCITQAGFCGIQTRSAAAGSEAITPETDLLQAEMLKTKPRTHQNAHESFFMSDEDSEKAISLAKRSAESEQHENNPLQLSGIFFVDESNWTVWIGDATYSTLGKYGDFSIDKVTDAAVTVTTSEGNTLELSVTC